MKRFPCPKCKQESIPVKDKYLAGFWKIIFCNNCNARLCANPFILGLMLMVYVWAVLWFVAMGHFFDNWSLTLYLIPTWLLLDFLNIKLIPLTAMPSKK